MAPSGYSKHHFFFFFFNSKKSPRASLGEPCVRREITRDCKYAWRGSEARRSATDTAPPREVKGSSFGRSRHSWVNLPATPLGVGGVSGSWARSSAWRRAKTPQPCTGAGLKPSCGRRVLAWMPMPNRPYLCIGIQPNGGPPVRA